ncbi:MAG: hypothetical protein AB8H86_19875 [Polyangiales bacterium]
MEESELAAHAREGRLDALYEHSFAHPVRGYKWLLYAMDLGNESAEELLGDVEEHVDAFHLGEGYSELEAHLSLAGEYLRAAHGIAFDFAVACRHLDEYLMGITGMVMEEDAVRASTLEEFSEGLDDEHQAKLEEFFDEVPFRQVAWRVERITRLRRFNAPAAILANECERLRESVELVTKLVGSSE